MMFSCGFYAARAPRRPVRRASTTATTWTMGPARLSAMVWLLADGDGTDCPTVSIPVSPDDDRPAVYYRDPLL